MATINRVQLDRNPSLGSTGQASASRYLVSESKTATAPAVTGGDVTSAAVVPAGEFWILRSVRAVNGDTATRNIEIQILDADGAVHAVLAEGVSPVAVAAGASLVSNKEFLLPAGWQVQVKWIGLAADISVNWQYVTLEVNADVLYQQDLLV